MSWSLGVTIGDDVEADSINDIKCIVAHYDLDIGQQLFDGGASSHERVLPTDLGR